MRRFLFPKSNKKSQIAVIVTLIIAMILLISVVFINVAKVSDIKAATAMAADRGALALGSSMTMIVSSYLKMVHQNGLFSWDSGERKECLINIMQIIGILAILAGLVFAILAPTIIVLFAAGVLMTWGSMVVLAEVNAYLRDGAAKMLTEMTAYTSVRETALLGMVQSVPITDTVRVVGGGGVYTDPSTGISFDLTKSPIASVLKQKNPPAIPRFVAWYYGKRIPNVSEAALAVPIQEMIALMMSGMYFKDEGDWNEKLWRYEHLTLAVELPEGHITCDVCGKCEDLEWLTKEELKVAFVGPIQLEELRTPIISDISEFIFGIPGFLTKRFPDLCHKIIDQYGERALVYGDTGAGEYISKDGNFFGIGYDDAPIFSVATDIKTFINHVMELANLPISERIPNLSAWLPVWFDFTQHQPSGSGWTNSAPGSSESSFDSLGHDEYQRILRVRLQLAEWLKLLEGIDKTVVENIDTPKLDSGEESFCEQGRGEPVEKCFTQLMECGPCCDAEDECDGCCGESCEDEEWARWLGDYATCTGSGFNHKGHPMCNGPFKGDLYRTQPCDEWCDELREPIPCQQNQDLCCSDCLIPETKTVREGAESFKAFYFQGQRSWMSVEGMTEVEQAIEILSGIDDYLKRVQAKILEVAGLAYKIIHENPMTKKDLCYVWNDVYPGTTENNGNYHLVRAKVEGYPTFEEFPSIVQTREYWNFVICREFKGNIEGDFQVFVSRYDTDQPGFWWNLRRRRVQVEGPQDLSGLEMSIMSTGLTPGNMDAYAAVGLESVSQGHYGRKKEEITYKPLR